MFTALKITLWGNDVAAVIFIICYSYSPSGKWTSRHQLSLNGKHDDFTQDDLLAVAPKADVRYAKVIIQHIIDVVSSWKTYAKAASVKPVHIVPIQQSLRTGI